MGNPSIWPTLAYADADDAVRFLVDAFGFETVAVHTDPNDDKVIVHAELRWPEGTGGVMLSSVGTGDSGYEERGSGSGSVYVVCSDPDTVLDRATAAGATVVRPLADEDYGSRNFVVQDREGNLWAFGTYAGTQR